MNGNLNWIRGILLFLLLGVQVCLGVGPCQLLLPGDLDQDCDVDMEDLAWLAWVWLIDWSGQEGAFLPEPAIFVSESDTWAIDSPGCGRGPSGWCVDCFPCRSIGWGIQEADMLGYSHVFVADGWYEETVPVPPGITLWGGFDPMTWVRNDPQQSHTVVRGTGSPHKTTFAAMYVDRPTEVSGFVIEGADATAGGGNSYAVWIIESTSALVFEDNRIFAGRGGDGVNGADGTDGPAGVNGGGAAGYPDAAYDAFITDGSPCGSGNNRQYSNGGALIVGKDNISGGDGGGNICPPSGGVEFSGLDGEAGYGGGGAGGGAGGAGGDAGDDGSISRLLCSHPTSPMRGADGGDGMNGRFGRGGSGATYGLGTVAVGQWNWAGSSGGTGEVGGNGGGGGGGGAGGGGEELTAGLYDRLGAHGGGGGSGGVAGTAGRGGNAGGGSFGFFIVNSVSREDGPTLAGNVIYAGRGGAGGDGGFGGAGGAGGKGGRGGGCSGNCLCYDAAGDGGDGGAGGHGGGGGGGAGGVSYGLFTWNVAGTLYYHYHNEFAGTPTGGAGGKGGKSMGEEGSDGVSGSAAQYLYR